MGEKLTPEELAAIRGRHEAYDAGQVAELPLVCTQRAEDRRKLLAHIDELQEEHVDALRELDIADSRRDKMQATIGALRAAAAELLAALPKCDTKGCDAQAVYLDEDGPVYCGDHCSVVDAGDELEHAAPAARLLALLGKAGA